MGVTRFSGLSIKGGNSYNSLSVGYPTIMAAPTATDGGIGTTASVAFTAQTGATSYTALSSPGSFTGTGSSSPITVSGLTTGTAYTFQIRANNSVGSGPYSAASNSVTPATPPSFESIASSNVPGGTTTLTFSSIPTTFKHLQIRGWGRTSSGLAVDGAVVLRANSDTGTNYTRHSLYGNGTNTIASGSASTISIDIHSQIPGDGALANTYGVFIVDILDYGSTSKNKTVRSFWGADTNTSSTNWRVGINSGVWMSTSAITSISIIFPSSVYGTDSSIALYGIKEA